MTLELTEPVVELDAVKVVDAEAAGGRLTVLSLVDSTLLRCNFANVSAQRASLVRVEIDESRLTGLELQDALLRDVRLRETRLDLAGLRFARLDRVAFEDSRLEQADFHGAQLKSVSFVRCDLSRADFTGATLDECQLRRCTLTGLTGAANLRGAALEWEDVIEGAALWATALGIEILETEGNAR